MKMESGIQPRPECTAVECARVGTRPVAPGAVSGPQPSELPRGMGSWGPAGWPCVLVWPQTISRGLPGGAARGRHLRLHQRQLQTLPLPLRSGAVFSHMFPGVC